MKRFLQLLKQPYPIEKPVAQNLLEAFLLSLFIFLFLFLFGPFGLSGLPSQKLLWVTLGYGAVTFGAMLVLDTLLPRLFPKVYSDKRWTVGAEILYFALNLFVIGIGNLLYTHWVGFTRITWFAFWSLQIGTLMVGFFPGTLMVLLAYLQRLRKYLKAAQQLSSDIHQPHAEHQSQPLVLKGENQQDHIACTTSELLAITSADNYLEVFLLKDGQPVRTIIRGSLSAMEQQLAEIEQMYRCHRSHLVNLDHVQDVTGNAQGYKLVLHPDMEAIPVARRQSAALRERLQHL